MYATCQPVSRVVRTTEPTAAQEPITLAEAKHQCGLDGGDYHNEYLSGAIASARRKFESDTGIACYTGTHTYKLNNWPAEWFEIPVRPVTSITSIAYIDIAGVSQTLSTDIYALEANAVTPFVRLKYGQTWPSLRGDVNGITVTLVAGYSSVLTIPQEIKNAIRLAVHVDWLLKTEKADEATRQNEGYERCIRNLMRSSYP